MGLMVRGGCSAVRRGSGVVIVARMNAQHHVTCVNIQYMFNYSESSANGSSRSHPTIPVRMPTVPSCCLLFDRPKI